MSTHNGSPAGWSGRARRGGGSLCDNDVKENGSGVDGDGGQEEEEDEWSLLSEEERECLRYFDATVESAAAPEPPGEGDPQGDPRKPREARRSVHHNHHHHHHSNQKHHENGLEDDAAVMRYPRESGGHAGRHGTPPGTPPGTPATPGSQGEGDAELGAEEMAALRYLDASIRHGEQELRDFPDPAGMAPEARAVLPEAFGGDAGPRSRRPFLFPRPSVRLPDGRPSDAETVSRGRGRSADDERNEDDERRDDEDAGNEEDKAEEVDEVTDVSTGPHRVRAQLRTTGTRGVDEEGGDGTRGLRRGGGGGGSGAGCGRVGGGGGGGCGGGGDRMRADVGRADGERGDGGRGGCGDGRPNGGGGAQRLENQGPGVEPERCRGTGVVRRCSVKFPAGPGQDHARQEALARLGLLKKDSVGKGDPRGPRSPQCGPRGPARAPSPGPPLSPGPSSPTGSASPTSPMGPSSPTGSASPTSPTGPSGHAGDGSRGPGQAGRSPPRGQQGQPRPGLRPSGITVHFSPRGRAAEEEHREALRKLGLLKA